MRPYLILFALLLAISAAIMFAPFDASVVVKEGGVVESATAILYGVLIALILLLRKMRWPRGNYLSALILLVLLFRELDFDKAFTTMGIFKTTFYKSSGIPALEKLVALIVIVLISVTFIVFLKHYQKNFLAGIRRLSQPELGVAMAVFLGLFSKLILDGLPRKLAGMGLSPGDFVTKKHEVLEETLELGIPVSLLVSFYYLCRRAKPHEEEQG